tara:strand:- start:115 stop:372 length:258 start_codon:yes stop_codon:yes gene_type:complete
MARSNGAAFYFSLREVAHCLTERRSSNRYVAHVVRNIDLANRIGIQAGVTGECTKHIARAYLLFTARINLYCGHGAPQAVIWVAV